MANKGGIVTIFVNIIPAAAGRYDFEQGSLQMISLDFTHVHFSLSLFGILHFVSMDGNNRRLMSSECT